MVLPNMRLILFLLMVFSGITSCSKLESDVYGCIPGAVSKSFNIAYSGGYWGDGRLSISRSESQPDKLKLDLYLYHPVEKQVVVARIGGSGYCEGHILKANLGAAEVMDAQLRIIGGELTGMLDESPNPSFGIWELKAVKQNESESSIVSLEGNWRQIESEQQQSPYSTEINNDL